MKIEQTLAFVTTVSNLRANIFWHHAITILQKWDQQFQLLIVWEMLKFTTVSYHHNFNQHIVDIGNRASLNYLVKDHIARN
jgi:hypothetical protein